MGQHPCASRSGRGAKRKKSIVRRDDGCDRHLHFVKSLRSFITDPTLGELVCDRRSLRGQLVSRLGRCMEMHRQIYQGTYHIVQFMDPSGHSKRTRIINIYTHRTSLPTLFCVLSPLLPACSLSLYGNLRMVLCMTFSADPAVLLLYQSRHLNMSHTPSSAFRTMDDRRFPIAFVIKSVTPARLPSLATTSR